MCAPWPRPPLSIVSAGMPRLRGRFESVDPSENVTGRPSALETETAAWTMGAVVGTRPAGRVPTVSMDAAYVHPSDGEPGRQFDIKVGGGKRIKGVVTKYPFYDPDNKRQEM